MSDFDRKKEAPESADPKTIQRDVDPGKSTKVEADQAVNAALETAGSGTAHESGATFHDDSTAHSAADALGAKAFTAGSDVYFGAGNYSPGSDAGDSLIQHELTHVEQSQGVEPPKPGDFRVSSPSDATEVAAREGGGGGSAAPSTIHRLDEGESGTEGTGPSAGSGGGSGGSGTASGGSGPASGGSAPASDTADPYEAWKTAVNSYNRADAKTKWGKVPGSDKAKAAGEDRTFQGRVVFTMEEDSVLVIKESGIPIGNVAGRIFLQPSFANFLAPLRTHNLLNAFLDSGGQGWLVDDDKVAKLKLWVDLTTSRTEAKRIFERPYPTLHDTPPGPVSFSGVVAPWPLARIKRLYTVLAQYLDPGHAATITGGFVYVTSPLFGWWSPSQRRVFLPASSDSSGHDMTGGTARGHHATDPKNAKGQFTSTSGRSVSADFTGADGKKKTGAAAQMGHFTGTILHEVGHGVGARIDGGKGNAYAENPSSWPAFHVNMSLGDWANELWVSGARGSGSEPSVDSDAKLDESHAKDFFKTELTQGKGSYDPGWGSSPSRSDMATYVKWRYADVPLQKWWNYFVELGNPKGSSYAWDNESARIRNGWCYSYLSRGGSGWTKFKDHTWYKKVSWYGISSPKEWFAEQYTHYYRTEKTGSGMDSATLALMKDLDSKQFAPSSSASGGGVTIGDSSGSSSGGGGSSEDGGISQAGGDTNADAAASENQPNQDEQSAEPLFFPW